MSSMISSICLVAYLLLCIPTQLQSWSTYNDPYAVVTLGSTSLVTATERSGGATARWAQEFVFANALTSVGQSLAVQVFDKRSWGEDVLIGACSVRFEELLTYDGGPPAWFGLACTAGKPAGEVSLLINMS
eukprot:SAG31_NODE_7487_length_1675_cov_6.987310_2_plen_131_part_00